jgi:hypothetical protein
MKIDRDNEVFQGLVPAPGTLLQTIEGFLKFQAMSRRELHSYTARDFDEEVLFGNAIEEGTFHIHLLDVEVVKHRQDKDELQGSESTDGSKGGIVVNALNFPEPANTKTGLVLEEFAVSVKLAFEHPCGVERFGPGGERSDHPYFMLLNVVEFNFHSHEPMRFIKPA